MLIIFTPLKINMNYYLIINFVKPKITWTTLAQKFQAAAGGHAAFHRSRHDCWAARAEGNLFTYLFIFNLLLSLSKRNLPKNRSIEKLGSARTKQLIGKVRARYIGTARLRHVIVVEDGARGGCCCRSRWNRYTSFVSHRVTWFPICSVHFSVDRFVYAYLYQWLDTS